ncbi:hypothetical protein IDM40_23030 [Nocardiopsis sp. HNM0947]|uniref:Uncharacterized protein n=1 Tax=Nocardiopsis coralli TaxID=2772213 RepID=A0ABR9PCI2_9ACTN|nr:hypothetical protein [Nocardiopsis coralli]MBE3001543.1 hypothetical protein [Nocardiopsis coralli]
MNHPAPDTHDSWWELALAVPRSYPRALVPLMVAAVLPLAPLVLLSAPLSVWTTGRAAHVNGVLEPALAPLPDQFAILAGLLLLLALAVTPVAAGAGVLIAATTLLGRRLGVRDAWRHALRRYGTGAVWLLFTLTLLALVIAGAAFALALEWPPLVVGLLSVPLFVFLWTPVLVMLPVALLEGRGPWRSLARAWLMGRTRRRLHLACAAIAVGLGYPLGAGLDLLLSATPLVEGGAAVGAVKLLAWLGLAPLLLLVVSAPAAFHGNFPLWNDRDVTHRRVRDPGSGLPTGTIVRENPDGRTLGDLPSLDLARARAHLPEPGERRPVRRTTAVLVGAALVLPPLAAPVAVAAGPVDPPELTAAPSTLTTGSEPLITGMAEDGGVEFSTVGDRGMGHVVCDPECTPSGEVSGDQDHSVMGPSPLVEVADGYARTAWHDGRPFDGPDDPSEDSGLYLFVCENAEDCLEGAADGAGTQLRPFGENTYDARSAVAPLGDGLVVVSHSGFQEKKDPTAEDGDLGGLRAHVCEDLECSDPSVVEFPDEVSTESYHARDHRIDVVPAGDGFAATLTDNAFGTVTVHSCTDPGCTDPEVTEVLGEQFAARTDDGPPPRTGTTLREGPDGTPVIVLRHPLTGTVQVVDCQDTACTDRTEKTVTGPGWARPEPGVDQDSEGRLQILTYDYADLRMVLLSCVESGCAEVERTPLVGFEGSPDRSTLVMDELDRPHILWNTPPSRQPDEDEEDDDPIARDRPPELEHLRCAEPWCGADL